MQVDERAAMFEEDKSTRGTRSRRLPKRSLPIAKRMCTVEMLILTRALHHAVHFPDQ